MHKTSYTFMLIFKHLFFTVYKKFKIFHFILFEKRCLAHGIRQPKTADSPLPPI